MGERRYGQMQGGAGGTRRARRGVGAYVRGSGGIYYAALGTTVRPARPMKPLGYPSQSGRTDLPEDRKNQEARAAWARKMGRGEIGTPSYSGGVNFDIPQLGIRTNIGGRRTDVPYNFYGGYGGGYGFGGTSPILDSGSSGGGGGTDWMTLINTGLGVVGEVVKAFGGSSSGGTALAAPTLGSGGPGLTSFLGGGGKSGGGGASGMFGGKKKSRRMNALNVRALGRADRRIKAARKVVRKLGLIKLTGGGGRCCPPKRKACR